MEMNKFKTVILLLSTLLLASCGSGGSDAPTTGTAVGASDTGNPDTEHTDPATTALEITVPDSIDLSDSKYSIAGGLESASATGETIKITKDAKSVVSLMKGRALILSGRKYAGDSSVNVSLESSAVVMVLMQPRFLGSSSINPKELEKRIKSHDKFQDLVGTIKTDIDEESPCPIDPICNSEANNFADKIATEIQITDLF